MKNVSKISWDKNVEKNKGGNRVKSYVGACDYVLMNWNKYKFIVHSHWDFWLIDGRPFSFSWKVKSMVEKGQNVEHVVYDKQNLKMVKM